MDRITDTERIVGASTTAPENNLPDNYHCRSNSNAIASHVPWTASKDYDRRLKNLLCDCGGANKVDEMMEVYNDFRQSGQVLTIAGFHSLTMELNKYNKSSFIIKLLEDHEDVLRRSRYQPMRFLSYLYFMQSCIMLNDYNKASTYSEKVLFDLLKVPTDNLTMKHTKAKMMISYATVCWKMGNNDDAMLFHEAAQEQLGEILKVHKNIGFIGRNHADSLGMQARIIISKSIADHGCVKPFFRKEILKKYREAIGILIESVKLDPEIDTIYDLAAALRSVGFEFGKMKRWDKAHTYFNRSVDLVEDYSDIVPEKIMRQEFSMSLRLIGIAYLEQYHQNLLDSDLTQAVHFTEQAMIQSERGNDVLLLDRAQQQYFLGNFNEAFESLTRYLDKSSAASYNNICHTCDQKHADDAVVVICPDCKTTYYCNALCRNLDLMQGGEKCVAHKALCPLLNSWRKVRERNCDSIDSVARLSWGNVTKTEEGKKIEELFRAYFEAFRLHATNSNAVSLLARTRV